MREHSSTKLPRISPLLMRWFTWYAKRHIRRHFHALRVARENSCLRTGERPCVLFLNHASWWDPLVCLALRDRFFAERRAYAPIDASMLERYSFFKRLGFFGVAQNSRAGAVAFYRTAKEILSAEDTLLVVTPQGRFADARERPARFAAGLGHLAARVPNVLFIPLALEYVFWEERFPEILARFGEPLEIEQDIDPSQCTALLESKLSATQDVLSFQSQNRCAVEFDTIIGGRAGAAAIYDFWRQLKATLGSSEFRKEHGTV